MDSGRRLAT